MAWTGSPAAWPTALASVLPTRTSTRWSSGCCIRRSATWPASCTPGVRATIRSPPTSGSGALPRSSRWIGSSGHWPVAWAEVLLAHAWPLVRDRDRLADAARRVAVLPLGSGALAGSGVPVNRDLLREELGFRAISPNALDATGERDFVVEIVFVLALLMTHVSRLAGELFTYSTTEFGFVRLADGYCTGSSLMPQKRNPDVLELARVKVARTLSDVVGLLTALKGLPAGYSKDLQEDKVFLFDAVDTVRLTLPAVRGAVATMEPVPERMSAALQRGMLATDLADGLVAQGVPFREAHGLVGRLVQEGE